MMKVALLYGGRSGEHDVSRCSAASVHSALDRDRFDVIAVGIDRDGTWYVQDDPIVRDDRDFGKVLDIQKDGKWLIDLSGRGALVLVDMETGRSVSADVVFPAVHGTYCEDGSLQGLLDTVMVPYVGADVVGSAVGIDKDIAKRLLRDAGIPVVPWRSLCVTGSRGFIQNEIDDVIAELGLPLFVKPVRTGSSVGVYKAKNRDDLVRAIEGALQFDTHILIEKGINAREIECAVLGNDMPVASVTGEIVPSHEFYSYESKYIDPDGAELVIPAPIDRGLSESIRKTAVEVFKILKCNGMARVDFFLCRETGSF